MASELAGDAVDHDHVFTGQGKEANSRCDGLVAHPGHSDDGSSRGRAAFDADAVGGITDPAIELVKVRHQYDLDRLPISKVISAHVPSRGRKGAQLRAGRMDDRGASDR